MVDRVDRGMRARDDQPPELMRPPAASEALTKASRVSLLDRLEQRMDIDALELLDEIARPSKTPAFVILTNQDQRRGSVRGVLFEAPNQRRLDIDVPYVPQRAPHSLVTLGDRFLTFAARHDRNERQKLAYASRGDPRVVNGFNAAVIDTGEVASNAGGLLIE